MLTIDTDDALLGAKPPSLPEWLWTLAQDIVEENLHELHLTLHIALDADDLSAVSVYDFLALAGRRAERRETACSQAAWQAVADTGNNTATALLVPDALWLSTEIRQVLETSCRTEEGRLA